MSVSAFFSSWEVWLLFSHEPSPYGLATATTLLRIGLGLAIAYYHGWHKLADGLAWRSGRQSTWVFADEIRAAGFPFPVANAILATAAQLGAGVGLCLGLLTRPCAIVLTATLLGAVYTNIVLHKPQQLAALYLLVAVAVLLFGPGRLALDSMLFPSVLVSHSSP